MLLPRRGPLCFACGRLPRAGTDSFCSRCGAIYREWDRLSEQALAESWPRQVIDFTGAPLLRFLIATERHGAWHHATDPERTYF